MGELHNRANRTDHRRELRKNLTGPERLLWAKIRAGQLGVKFRRQHSIGSYIVDFYSAEIRLVIELDGDSHYASEQARSYDRERDRYLSELDLTVMRFSNNDVMTNLDGVRQSILSAIAKFAPTPALPLTGEGAVDSTGQA